jgi:hypothetical protein
MLRLRITAAFIAVASLAAPGIATAETVTVARSAKLGIEIKAETDASGIWCTENATLYLQHGADSQLVGSEAGFFPKLEKVFAAECPAMETATVAILNPAGTKTGRIHIAKSAGWSGVSEPQTQTAEAAAAAGATSDSPTELPKAAPVKVEPVPLTRELLHLLRLKFDPKARENGKLHKLMVAEIYCEEAANLEDEFARQDFFRTKIPLLLARVAEVPTFARILLRIDGIGEYDFATKQFPYAPLQPNHTVEYSDGPCIRMDYDSTFSEYEVTLLPFAPLTGLPMNEEAARRLNDLFSSDQSLRRYQSFVAIDIDISSTIPEAWPRKPWERATTAFGGSVKEIVVSLDENQQHVVARISEAEIGRKLAAFEEEQRLIAAARVEEEQRRLQARLDAEAAQAAEEKSRRQARLEAEAEHLYGRLMALDALARLAYLTFGSAEVHQANQAIAISAMTGDVVQRTLVFKTGEQVRRGWRTAWPANLTVEDPALEGGTWYVAQGALRAEEAEEGRLMGFFAPIEIARCEGDPCATSDAEARRFIAEQYPHWTGYPAASSPTE